MFNYQCSIDPIAIGLPNVQESDSGGTGVLGMTREWLTAYCLLPTEIDVRALPSGIYFLKVEGADYSASAKVCVVH